MILTEAENGPPLVNETENPVGAVMVTSPVRAVPERSKLCSGEGLGSMVVNSSKSEVSVSSLGLTRPVNSKVPPIGSETSSSETVVDSRLAAVFAEDPI